MIEKAGEESKVAFDYKKEYKEFYMPARRRTVILHPVKSERRRMHEGGIK